MGKNSLVHELEVILHSLAEYRDAQQAHKWHRDGGCHEKEAGGCRGASRRTVHLAAGFIAHIRSHQIVY